MIKKGLRRRRFLQACSVLALTNFTLTPFDSFASPIASHKKKLRVRDLNMAYYEVGEGKPIVFIHGNPTSSYQWRNIIPYVQHLGRCIAPDMIGMGDSDRLPDSGPGKYSYITHRDYMFELFEKLGIKDDVIFVVHDWGSAMGFEWAYHNPKRVKGIAYYEAMISRPDASRPVPTSGPFAMLRSPAGEKAVLEENMFVEKMLIDRLGYYLSEEDKAEYRRPYLQTGESRRPTLTWPRELALGGEPKVNDDIIKTYSKWLAKDTRIPKLFINGIPGAIFSYKPLLEFVRTFKNQKEISVYGRHHLQETAPDAMGRALAEWIQGIDR